MSKRKMTEAEALDALLSRVGWDSDEQRDSVREALLGRDDTVRASTAEEDAADNDVRAAIESGDLTVAQVLDMSDEQLAELRAARFQRD